MDKSIQESMRKVYKENLWSGQSKSGRGSDQINTQHIELELPYIIDAFNINSILDIPCGDFAWMPRLLANLPEHISYHGADIVQEIIDDNQKYANDMVSFSCLDITSDKLPDADLVLVRDCFNHLPYESIFKALRNLKNSNIKYIALTHFNWRRTLNKDIENKPGQKVSWRKLNYTIEPFYFSPPLDVIVEGSTETLGKDKTISIWNLDDIKL